MFMPEVMAAQFNISPIGIHGLSTVRGDLGGLFLGLAVMSFLGLQRPLMLFAASILLGAVAIGRVFGFLFDGVTSFTVMLCLVEVMLMAIFIVLAVGTQASLNPSPVKTESNANDKT